MLLHDENDNDVPIAEAEQSYVVLHDVGVEVVMVRHPREGYGVQATAAAEKTAPAPIPSPVGRSSFPADT